MPPGAVRCRQGPSGAVRGRQGPSGTVRYRQIPSGTVSYYQVLSGPMSNLKISLVAFEKSVDHGDHNENKIQWNLDNSNCREPPKKFELWVMLSLCFSHVATVASQFRSSIFHFLAKLSKICEIFFSCETKTMKLSLVHKNVNTSSHRIGNLMALTIVYQFELWLTVRDMPSKLSLSGQGPQNLVWVGQVFELSEVELTKFHVMLIDSQQFILLK